MSHVHAAPKRPSPRAPEPVRLGLASKLAAEFLGAAFLCFTVAVAAPQGANAPVAIGSMLMCLIYAGGHVSGAHFNPAVSLAICVRGTLPIVELPAYVLAQLAGACSAGAISKHFVAGSIGFPSAAEGVGYGPAIVEGIITFALCHTVLHVTTTVKQANNSYYGLAVGAAVLSGAVSVGNLSGGAFNPAVGMLAYVHSMPRGALLDPGALVASLASTFADGAWIYIAGPLGGALCAGLLFRFTHPSELARPASAVLVPLRETMAPFVIEMLGTFFLCFTVATAASPSNPSNLAPLAASAMLVAQVYAGGPTSGGHYNPAVTLAIFVRRALSSDRSNTLPLPTAFGYVLVQCVAAGLAAFLTSRLPSITPGYPVPAVSDGLAVAAEAVGTFVLVSVVLQVATALKTAGNSFFGLAIGGAVGAMAGTLEGVSGAAFNPAVGLLGLAAADWSSLASLAAACNWVYTVGPCIGALLATAVYRVVSFDEFAPLSTTKSMSMM